ncbi:MAG: hypothetical protein MJZ30_09550 [Paludibacteraceae bacterium]|nr:hypothetical protein [Paludibacteraceae bacterium]
MADIKFEIVQNIDEVQSEIEKFRKIVAKVASNSVFQFRNHLLLGECYDIMEFIINGDISPTLLEKIKDLEERIDNALNDDVFKSLCESIRLMNNL